MLNKLLIIIACFNFWGCSNTTKVNTTKKEIVTKVKKKGRKMFGEITTYTPKVSSAVKTNEFPTDNLDLFFKSDKDFYKIIIAKSEVPETKIKSEMNKPLKIWGDIISSETLTKQNIAGYIIIYEMFPSK
ncbi:MAG: hypothetical protein P8Q14_08970 [Vicingaceae bacterium]|nr:hypothetical protein [Vicingaceae bacterium]